MNQEMCNVYAIGYAKGLADAVAVFRKIDAEHPEYKMPMELTIRLGKLKGSVEDYLYEHDGGMNDGKNDIF